MNKPKVVCSADIEHLPEVKSMLKDNFTVIYTPPIADEILKCIEDAEIYFASLHCRFTGKMIKKAEKLKVIATPSTGLDHIDIEHAKKAGVKILSLKDERSFIDKITATAELTWALLLSCARHLNSATESAKKGKWARDEFRGHQLAYKTLGILGCGRLGSMVAEYGKAFRMNVIACDKVKIDLPWVKQVSFDELLASSDVLSIHIHLTDENKNLLNRDAFEKIKRGSVLINTSRGAIIDEDALAQALEKGIISAAGLDVINGEWRNDLQNHVLIKYMRDHDNLVITPHIGGVTFESQKMAYEYILGKIIKYLDS